MVDEGYHTHANLRTLSGMPANPGPPTDANLTIWVDMIDAVIESYKSSPDTSIAQGIEINRMKIIYEASSPALNMEPWKKGDPLIIDPLTKNEENLLDGNWSVYWK